MPEPPAGRLSLFAVAAPGLERLVADELRALGIDAAPEPGGVAWEGGAEELYAANLHLGTTTRVLVRVGEFGARAFWELEKRARRLPWEAFVPEDRRVALRVTANRSRLYHERAIAERIAGSIEAACGPIVLGPASADDPADGSEADADADDAPASPPQLFVVRVFRDRVTVSADSSGDLLHRRGYRQAVARAPLRETLAAALLSAGGWPGDAPLLDPFCGSGTIPIEAALRARRIPPGLATTERAARRWAFQGWPGFRSDVLDDVVDRARAGILPSASVPLRGSDRDKGAIDAAWANAERAGVADDVEFSARALSAAEPPRGGPGWLVANPPYGLRVGESAPLRDLYAALGNLARRALAGWRLALLSADPALERQVGLPFEERVRTTNGGIPVRVVVAEVPETRERDRSAGG